MLSLIYIKGVGFVGLSTNPKTFIYMREIGGGTNMKGHNWGVCRLCGKDHGINPSLGRRRSKETRKKLSVAHKGIRPSKETKKKISDATKGERNHNYGNPPSEETREKLSVANRGRHPSNKTREKLSIAHRGIRHSKEHKEKLSLANKGKRRSEETKRRIGKITTAQWASGRFSEVKMGTGVSGKRADLNNQFFRSTWEANVARIMNYWGIKWEYEVKRITYNNGTKTHMIDFYLPETDSYLEVFGILNERHLEEFYGVYESGLSVQLIGPDIYRDLEKEFKDKLPFWENGRKKTKTLNT